MHALFDAHDAHVSHRKHLSSSFFEIFQPPDDSSRMKQAVDETDCKKCYSHLKIYAKYYLSRIILVYYCKCYNLIGYSLSTLYTLN